VKFYSKNIQWAAEVGQKSSKKVKAMFPQPPKYSVKKIRKKEDLCKSETEAEAKIEAGDPKSIDDQITIFIK
jgi:hypothetical protein